MRRLSLALASAFLAGALASPAHALTWPWVRYDQPYTRAIPQGEWINQWVHIWHPWLWFCDDDTRYWQETYQDLDGDGLVSPGDFFRSRDPDLVVRWHQVTSIGVFFTLISDEPRIGLSCYWDGGVLAPGHSPAGATLDALCVDPIISWAPYDVHAWGDAGDGVCGIGDTLWMEGFAVSGEVPVLIQDAHLGMGVSDTQPVEVRRTTWGAIKRVMR